MGYRLRLYVLRTIRTIRHIEFLCIKIDYASFVLAHAAHARLSAHPPQLTMTVSALPAAEMAPLRRQ